MTPYRRRPLVDRTFIVSRADAKEEVLTTFTPRSSLFPWARFDQRLVPWFAWLVVFYTAWTAVLFGFDLFDEAAQHKPVALAMAAGSYVAGSTPMGGGTIGFPVLVLFFDAPASLGRNFGLMIQSVGMTSASILILCRRIPVAWSLLRFGLIGAAIGILVGTFVIVPLVSDTTVKLVFACLWCSFGALTLAKNSELCRLDRMPVIPSGAAFRVGSLVGVVGGVTTALTGVGIDMLLYTVLVLLYRSDLKVAVPTSVIIMAASSLMGTALHLVIGDLNAEVFHNWLAAAPVVILGAPLGAIFVNWISRKATLYFVGLLCLAQFVWTLYEVELDGGGWAFVAFNLFAATLGFSILYRVGSSLSGDVPAGSPRKAD